MTITGEQVKAARRLVKWTQDTLAAEVRISPSAIGAFETGQRRPSEQHVARMKRTLEDAGVEFVEEARDGRCARKWCAPRAEVYG